MLRLPDSSYSATGADDFKVCESTYLRALDHYHENGYSLFLLGDIEEFWENHIISVIANYREVILSEKRFFDDGRL